MIVSKEVMSDSMFRINLTEVEGSKSSSGKEVRGIEDQAGPGGLSMVVEHGGQGDQALQRAGVGRRMGAGFAGQLLSEIDRGFDVFVFLMRFWMLIRSLMLCWF